MKSTGIVRKVDDLGRIVLPRELRKVLDIEERDPLEIFVNGSTIVLEKYEPSCTLCGGTDGVVQYKNSCLCNLCVDDIAAQSGHLKQIPLGLGDTPEEQNGD